MRLEEPGPVREVRHAVERRSPRPRRAERALQAGLGSSPPPEPAVGADRVADVEPAAQRLRVVVGKLVGDQRSPTSAAAKRTASRLCVRGREHRERERPGDDGGRGRGGRDLERWRTAGRRATRRAPRRRRPRTARRLPGLERASASGSDPAQGAASIRRADGRPRAIRGHAGGGVPAPAGSSARRLPARWSPRAPTWSGSTSAPARPTGSAPSAPSRPRRRHRPRGDERGARRRRRSSSTPPPSSTSGARWTSSSGSTSAGPRPCSTPPATAGAERFVHISSVVVYGYDDPWPPGRGRLRRAYGIPYIDTKSASDRVARAGARS